MPEKYRLDIYPDRDFLLRVDRWRIEQPDAPTRAEAVRRLVDEALEAKAKQQPAPAPQRKRTKAAA
jgi:hypothetical protein